jgi:hydroxyacylglutathione hydrolase
MKIDHLILGAYQTNCYVLRSGETATDCLIVDPGLEAGDLLDFLHQHELNPVAVVLTHGHIDHMAGVAALRQEYPDTKVYIHKLDAEMLIEPRHNLSALVGVMFKTEPADVLIQDKSTVEEAGIKLDVLHTPGHTPGGICLYSKDEGVVFTNDTLFADSIGRSDFPGGSVAQLLSNIKDRLFTLPDDTKVYPGHGPETTIAHEKAHNPFLL